MARALAVAITLGALLLPAITAGAPAPYAPTMVSAATTPAAFALITWAPGTVTADFFNVYGTTAQGSLSLLATNLRSTEASVPTGFAGYAVSGVKDGVESQLVFPAAVVPDPCIDVSISPPGYTIDWTCTTSLLPASSKTPRREILLP